MFKEASIGYEIECFGTWYRNCSRWRAARLSQRRDRMLWVNFFINGTEPDTADNSRKRFLDCTNHPQTCRNISAWFSIQFTNSPPSIHRQQDPFLPGLIRPAAAWVALQIISINWSSQQGCLPLADHCWSVRWGSSPRSVRVARFRWVRHVCYV